MGKKRAWRQRLAERWFGDVIARRVENAVRVLDDAYWSPVDGSGLRSLDRDWSAQHDSLDETLQAWRGNPLARRIVSLAADYVVGSGVELRSEIPWVQAFLDEFWQLNAMDRRLYAWCEELTRAGELFIVLRTEAVSGAGFVRAIPAVRIREVQTDPDDLERELRYGEAVPGDLQARWWPSYWSAPQAEQVMLHYAINRAIGCVRGEGDLGPILPWLSRYDDWLLSRARLNHYKSAFLWDVTIAGRAAQGDALRKKRFRYRTPPQPGSIVVHDDSETWTAVSPKIEAWDAKEDGKALRLAVAAGAGIPLHFLSEGESATRATAAEMGDPTYRHYYRRQLELGAMLVDLLTVALRRAVAHGRGREEADYRLTVRFPDVTKSDNQAMAQSALWMAEAVERMAALGLLDRETALSLVLRFAGEGTDVEQVLARVREKGAVGEGPLPANGCPAGRLPPTGRDGEGQGWGSTPST